MWIVKQNTEGKVKKSINSFKYIAILYRETIRLSVNQHSRLICKRPNFGAFGMTKYDWNVVSDTYYDAIA